MTGELTSWLPGLEGLPFLQLKLMLKSTLEERMAWSPSSMVLLLCLFSSFCFFSASEMIPGQGRSSPTYVCLRIYCF